MMPTDDSYRLGRQRSRNAQKPRPAKRVMSAKKMIAVAVILAIVLTIPVRTYRVRRQSWGSLFWNNRTAYIFIGEGVQGYRFDYLGLAVEWVQELFPFGASAPADNHCSATVLEVNAHSVQSYSVNDFWLGTVEPFQGTLYAPNQLPNGGFMKWSGNHFVPATPAEIENFHEYLISLPKGPPVEPSYDNVEGWSQRVAAGEVVDTSPTEYVEKDSRVTIELDGQQLTFVMNSGFISRHAYVDLIRAGRPPERIWQLDQRGHRVSRAEYRAIFGKT